ncbi:uncharacterized protein LOC121504968 [Cheilinus undulatus]|uniref:uncharacterized protein LOC121504968 n=1 Tax=Cheilinus undulatus TaxID=241271 RepID=UPI001BD20EA5|nr:uncharacterized protein LOC121504968 [Cheilinus undulatus]
MTMFFVNILLLWTLRVAQFSSISQPVSFQTAKLGDPVTVRCHIKSEQNKRVWYKFTTWRRLQLVVTFNPRYNSSIFDFTFYQRFSVNLNRINNHLSISKTTWEDAGTYFCGVMYLNDVQFGSGTFLMVEGANMISDSVVQQPESLSVQSEGSVALSCSVTTHCEAKHISVMWLKNSPHSAAQIIYPSGYTNLSCGRTERGETTCVNHFSIRKLSHHDDGTYHCVVTSCGSMLFGSGTRINIDKQQPELSPAVVTLMISNIILVVVTFVLLWKLCTSWRKDAAGANVGCPEVHQR